MKKIKKQKFRSEIAMTAAAYSKEVTRRGGPAEVARQVGVLPSSVRKRMAGDSPVDAEAKIAVLSLPLAPAKPARTPRPASRAALGALSRPGRDKGAGAAENAP